MRRKTTYYKMLTPERRAEIAAAVGATGLRSQARFAVGKSPSSLEPSYKEEEADPMFMAVVAAQKAPDGYETMDVDFVPASESPMVQADQRFKHPPINSSGVVISTLDIGSCISFSFVRSGILEGESIVYSSPLV